MNANATLADNFVELACLTYHGTDGPERWAEAEALLIENPSLTSGNIASACAAGDVSEVKRIITADVSAIDRPTGPRAWPPLLYACYSRFSFPTETTTSVITWLIEQGANPDAHVWITGNCRFTALTGLIGDGELGLHRLPPHPSWEQLARLLLEAGAPANDSQALYNRCFRPDDAPLKLLFEFGLSADDSCNWHVTPERTPAPEPVLILTFLLWYAVTHGLHRRAQLLLAHGTHVHAVKLPYGEHRPLPLLVARSGDVALIQLFQNHGINLPTLEGVDALYATCQAGDLNQAKRLLTQNPHLATQAKPELTQALLTASARGQLDVMRTLLALGISPGTDGQRTALHEAAWNGQLDAIELLLASGADPKARDPDHHATPADWAKHNNQAAAAAHLNSPIP